MQSAMERQKRGRKQITSSPRTKQTLKFRKRLSPPTPFIYFSFRASKAILRTINFSVSYSTKNFPWPQRQLTSSQTLKIIRTSLNIDLALELDVTANFFSSSTKAWYVRAQLDYSAPIYNHENVSILEWLIQIQSSAFGVFCSGFVAAAVPPPDFAIFH